MRQGLIPLAFGLGASGSALQNQWQECRFELNTQDVGNTRLASQFQSTTYLLDRTTGTLKDSLTFDLVSAAQAGDMVAPGKWRHLNDIPLKPGTTYWVADHACTPGEE